MNRLTPEFLRYFRNDIAIKRVAESLGVIIKESEGFTRFICPICEDFNTSMHPKQNLGRCFKCHRNYNPIDLVMFYKGCKFKEAIKFLENLK